MYGWAPSVDTNFCSFTGSHFPGTDTANASDHLCLLDRGAA